MRTWAMRLTCFLDPLCYSSSSIFFASLCFNTYKKQPTTPGEIRQSFISFLFIMASTIFLYLTSVFPYPILLQFSKYSTRSFSSSMLSNGLGHGSMNHSPRNPDFEGSVGYCKIEHSSIYSNQLFFRSIHCSQHQFF